MVFKVSRGKKSEKTQKLRFYRAPRLNFKNINSYTYVHVNYSYGWILEATTELSPKLAAWQINKYKKLL